MVEGVLEKIDSESEDDVASYRFSILRGLLRLRVGLFASISEGLLLTVLFLRSIF
jgi:hypothetical protein